MKHWQETRAVVYRAVERIAAGRHVALATVVRIEGSAYRRPGAKMLIDPEGAPVGGVSGGCLEADVREIGVAVARGEAPRIRRYDTSTDEDTLWGLGLGCGGTIEVFVQPIRPDGMGVWEAVRRLLDGDAPFTISTALTGPVAGRALVALGGELVAGSSGDTALDATLARRAGVLAAAGRSQREAVGPADVFTEVLVPPPWLVVFGAGDDAMPLVHLAATIGFRVAVVDHRAGYLDPNRFPGAARRVEARAERAPKDLPLGSETFAVVMTHSLTQDRGWAQQLLASPVPYIGVLGPRARTEAMLDQLGVRGDERVFGPVGLNIGADGPEQIAVSVLAEVLAVRSSRSPHHLRERTVAIHAV